MGDECLDLDEQRSIDGRGRGHQGTDVQALDLDLVGEERVVCAEAGIARSGAEHDDASGEGFGDRQAGLERSLSHRFQDQIDTAGQAGDLLSQIGAPAVQDLVGTERFDGVALRW
ncbi:hypothetical protein SNA_20815 [Streptomyces natalensis ATCC 27448]|uniref:Uncharacterized protein n=1 Tax=Streptomyces natalensis ATCC 27448 TaxID=1240678 RepID=A0A0D7CHP4_9ACTN|nr:hypothetical protein SNA_20815 [Streptomyces natalensis ATCC 27448]